MPLPAQPTLYDNKGVPISVDPRIAGLNRVKPKPVNATPDTPLQRNGGASHQSSKRNACDDQQADLNKRVKADHARPFLLESPAIIAAPPPTPVSASPALSSRDTVRDFMAECAANGINITPSDLACRQSRSSACPPWPIEGIETIQQVAKDLLLALVRKGAADREKQFQVAVGTLRTCLNVEFLPHIDAWKADAEEKARSSQMIPPLSAVLESANPHHPISIPTQSVQTPPTMITSTPTIPIAFGVPPSRDTLRGQLAHARARLDRQDQDLKHKDNEIARSEEEIKRLDARLSQLSAHPQPAKIAKPASDLEMAALRRLNKDHVNKIESQKSQLSSLLEKNAHLKEKLRSAGISYEQIRGERHSEEKREGGNVGNGEKIESTCQDTWELKPRSQTPRLESSRHDVACGSDTSSILAPPMITNESRPSSEHTRQSDAYRSLSGTAKHRSKHDDSRSHWERSVVNTKAESSLPPKPSVPTGPRLTQVKIERGEIGTPNVYPQYNSSDGWGVYYTQ